MISDSGLLFAATLYVTCVLACKQLMQFVETLTCRWCATGSLRLWQRITPRAALHYIWTPNRLHSFSAEHQCWCPAFQRQRAEACATNSSILMNRSTIGYGTVLMFPLAGHIRTHNMHFLLIYRGPTCILRHETAFSQTNHSHLSLKNAWKWPQSRLQYKTILFLHKLCTESLPGKISSWLII